MRCVSYIFLSTFLYGWSNSAEAMRSSQTQWTLSGAVMAEAADTVTVARAIFNNMGVAFPGNVGAVFVSQSGKECFYDGTLSKSWGSNRWPEIQFFYYDK